jgi:DNA/RNA-binding domain of Phe-tRNA-synthetase-like protein
MIFSTSDTWRIKYPGAAAGVLAIQNVNNPEGHHGLEERKNELETNLRTRFSALNRQELDAIPPFPAYSAYFKNFKKTYHVFLQFESIIFKGKNIPNVAALVEGMFMAEMKNRLLTAGHDLSVIQSPVMLDVATGEEHYVVLKGQEQLLKRDDMYISDAQGIISSIIYGPDQRTQITPTTRQVLFTVYAPPGVGDQAVIAHLKDIRENVLLVSPEAEVSLLKVLSAG